MFKKNRLYLYSSESFNSQFENFLLGARILHLLIEHAQSH